jgi:hypothetical protein
VHLIIESTDSRLPYRQANFMVKIDRKLTGRTGDAMPPAVPNLPFELHGLIDRQPEHLTAFHHWPRRRCCRSWCHAGTASRSPLPQPLPPRSRAPSSSRADQRAPLGGVPPVAHAPCACQAIWQRRGTLLRTLRSYSPTMWSSIRVPQVPPRARATSGSAHLVEHRPDQPNR